MHNEDPIVDMPMTDSVKLGVLIHRMGTLENGVSSIGEKLDNIGNLYPTLATVELLLAPIRISLKELEEDKKNAERESIKNAAQFKLALVMAIISPILSLIVLGLMDRGR